MKKILSLLLVPYCSLSLSAAAGMTSDDAATEIGAYFASCLAGNVDGEFSHGLKIAPDEVARMRDVVWNEWKRANAAVEECKLAEPSPLADAGRMEWPIPAELEPDAVMPYVFGFKGESSEARPMYVFLHGSGPKDYEWNAVRNIAAKYNDAPSAYFIPQIPNEGEWYRWYQRGKQWAWERLLRQALLRDDIDADRVYLLGISEGAYGSQRLASFYADYLAGAGPMAGGEPLINAPAENLRNTAFMLRTGQRDFGFYRNVLTGITGVRLDSLERLHPGSYAHEVEIVPGAGHSIDYMPTSPWLRKHVRNPYPKSVYWENFEMDGRYRDGFYNLYVDERSNADTSQRTCYEMNIEGNRVDVKVQLVKYEAVSVGNDFGFPIAVDFRKTYTPATTGRFRVYLSNELVDLGKEVTLTVNGHEVYKGVLQPSIDDMVNSCARYFERARIYPASIQVDLSRLASGD